MRSRPRRAVGDPQIHHRLADLFGHLDGAVAVGLGQDDGKFLARYVCGFLAPRPAFSGPPHVFNIHATAIASPAALKNRFTSAPGFGALNK
jgi:hypothetical protein